MAESPFPSFLMGGFECSTPILPDGRRLDQVAAAQHDTQCRGDYGRLREAGILTVREAVRWPLVDRGEECDPTSLAPMVAALRQTGLTAIWDLFHYGYPPDVDLFSAEFPHRFAAYCAHVATYLTGVLPAPRFYTPINEISFFSWAAGHVGYFAPFARDRGAELKCQLVRACLAAVASIRGVDPSARFLHADPLIHLVPPLEAPELAPEVEQFNQETVFEAWQMLAGRKKPELGGTEATLDLVGLNLYRIGQWEYQREGRFLDPRDPRWTPIHELLVDAWQRLDRPLVISETSDNGPRRPGWLRELFREVQQARALGVPILGICWYPSVSCPDWHDPTSVFPAGLWDVVPSGRRLQRVPAAPVLEAVREVQSELGLSTALPLLDSPVPEDAAGPGVPATRLRRDSVARCPTMPDNFGRAFLLAGEQLSLSVYRLTAGQSVSTRSYHGVETALCVLEGAVHVTDWDAAVPLAQGEVVVVPAGSPCGLHNQADVPCLVLQVATPPPWSADFQGPEPPNAILSTADTTGSSAEA
jgi:mannose-6-phosphate isomerase-like protein (cupin superfamily)